MQKKYLKNNLKIVFTGGHARSTAYSVIQEIKHRHKDWSLYWIGSRDVLVGKNVLSLETSMFPKIGVNFLPIVSGRIQRRLTWWTIPELLKIPVGFIFALYYLLKLRPAVLVSMGGFAGFPLVVIARLLGISILVHEQTSAAGRANIYSSRFANKIALARADSTKFFDSKKSVVTGNPISSEVRKIKPKQNISSLPTILITGGASGSQKINDALREVLKEVLAKFRVIHQTGGFQFTEFTSLKKTLTPDLQRNYQVFSTIYPWDWASVLTKADLVVSRAGANIVSELMFVKTPAILIPISFAYLDEQVKNAKLASDFGIATILLEKNLSGPNLFNKIIEVMSNWKSFVNNTSEKISPDINAHKKVTDLVEKLIQER